MLTTTHASDLAPAVKALSDLTDLLKPMGFSLTRIEQLFEYFGLKTHDQLAEDPFFILRVLPQFSFADLVPVAAHFGIEQDDPRRVAGGLVQALQAATRQGHCGLPKTQLLQTANRILGVSKELIFAGIEALIEAQFFYETSLKGTVCIFLTRLWRQEKVIADKIQMQLQEPLTFNEAALQKALAENLEKESLALSESQTQAIEQAILSKVFILTGGPGVGKTTLTRLLTKAFAQKGFKIALCAPTGRAAKRLSEVTGHTAKTIHRLLGYDPFAEQFQYHGGALLPIDVIIIDEASMLDVPLCEALLQAIPVTAQIIFVGDVDQLPAIGPGDVLRSLLSYQAIPQCHLTTIYRQAENSQIILNAHRVNLGALPQPDNDPDGDFFVIQSADPEKQLELLQTLVQERLPAKFGIDSIEDCQVLSLMNDGVLGINGLNVLLQAQLNPAVSHKNEVKHFDGLLREGDKVIQIVNNYEKNVFNGDVGIIESIIAKPKTIWVRYDQALIKYKGKSLKELKLAYALTVHKAQGSEYPVVIVILSKTQAALLKRNVFYTAITRGKQCVVILTDAQAIHRAVNNNTWVKRVVKLGELLEDGCPENPN